MTSPPPAPPVLLKGWQHFIVQLSQTLPTQLRRAHTIRRSAVARLPKGRP